MVDCNRCQHYHRQRHIEKQTNDLGVEARADPGHCYMFREKQPDCQILEPIKQVLCFAGEEIELKRT